MGIDQGERYSVQRSDFKRGFEWIDWKEVPKEKRDVPIVGILDDYTKFVPFEVVVLLVKEFQNDTGLIGKIMQEEIYSKSIANRHLDIVEKLITVVGNKNDNKTDACRDSN